MSSVEEYARKLKYWESEPINSISNILGRIQTLKTNETEDDLGLIEETLNIFHKKANKADNSIVDESWFKEVIKSKKHVKSLLEHLKKLKTKVPKLIKNNSKINYPESEWENKSEQYKVMIRLLYKSFIMNMDEEEVEKGKEKIAAFLDEVLSYLYEEFGLNLKEGKDKYQNGKILFRIEDVSKQLAKSSSTMAKKEMIDGTGDAKKVSKNDPHGFESKEAEKIRQERLEAIARENQTGFYDEMKKNINKDAKEECKLCHKLTAYCESQKQIRASDEPMTRFMICNSCNKRWRQE